MATTKRGRLGAHLEWHGQQIRVVVAVPPSKRKAIGATKLRESLNTASPREAEALKWPVLSRLKDRINGIAVKATEKLHEEAFRWREAVRDDESREGIVRQVLMDDVLPQVAKAHGEGKAVEMLAIADGRATPLGSHTKDMFTDRGYTARTEEKVTHAIELLKRWCERQNVATTIEGVDRKVANQFVREELVTSGKNSATSLDTIKWLGTYWRWLVSAGHLPEGTTNPWQGVGSENRLKTDRKRRVAAGYAKRPFTNEEVAKLMAGISEVVMKDAMMLAALSGMRPGEIAKLTVADCKGDQFHVRDGKTDNAIRTVPIHPALSDIVTRRSKDKAPTAKLFHDLPGKESVRRSAFAALSQAFTRRRRALGIGERSPDSQQDTADFYSFRRWFIRRAGEALEQGAKGFTPWTLAEVVGHDKEDGDLPLGLTMGRYPGAASEAAKRACVEAVKLPG